VRRDGATALGFVPLELDHGLAWPGALRQNGALSFGSASTIFFAALGDTKT